VITTTLKPTTSTQAEGKPVCYC